MAPDLTSNSVITPPANLPTTTGGAMTVSEFCRWACIGRTKMYAEIKSGRITPRKIGAKTVILRSDAEAWLRSLPTATAAADLDAEPA